MPAVSAGFRAGELGEISTFGPGTTTCEMLRKRGEDEKSHVEQLQNQFLLQNKQTVSSWCKSVGQNLCQLKQY